MDPKEFEAIKAAVKFAVASMGSEKLKTMSWFARNEREQMNQKKAA
jgi:hypothetical protein